MSDLDHFEIELSAETTQQLFELCNQLNLEDTTALIVNGVRFLKVNVDDLQLEDIKASMCDNYCCKRKEWKGYPDELIDEVCVNCPLSSL